MEREAARLFTGLMAQQSRATCGSAAPTAACPPTRSPVWSRAKVFVHRNVANVVVPTDQLPVHHPVRGRSAEGGAPDGRGPLRLRRRAGGAGGCARGLADNWIRHVKDVRDKHAALLDGIDHQWRPTRCASSTPLSRCEHRPFTVMAGMPGRAARRCRSTAGARQPAKRPDHQPA